MRSPTRTRANPPYEFSVAGSPVSVNRYGSKEYRDWKAVVYGASTAAPHWTGCLYPGACSVTVRYFRRKDRPKDVDNILKAILDGLDGKNGKNSKHADRVLDDDRHVQLATSMRTDLKLHTRFDGLSLSVEEFKAMLVARRSQAAVYVCTHDAPTHRLSVFGR